MAAFLYSIQTVNPEIKVEISLYTALAFLVTGGASWWAWEPFIRGTLENDKKRQRIAVIGATLMMVSGLIIATLRALKGNDKLAEMAMGAMLAVYVLSFVAFLIWRLGKFIDNDKPPPGYG